MKRFLFLFICILISTGAFAQFEMPQIDNKPFQKVKVKIGADFAMQYQALNQHADSTLVPIGKGVNLPTANMKLNAYLAPGIAVNVSIYLSSRHHLETWVEGGYIIMDRLPIKGTDEFMKNLTVKAGVMEVNFGDLHFFRSNNGNVIHNSFIGNPVMDAFTTAPALEIYFRKNGFLLMGGVSSGTLKPSLVGYSGYTHKYTPYNMMDELAFYGKTGIDKTFAKHQRVRVTASFYYNAKNHFGSLYFGDRTGTRFYMVMIRPTYSSTDVNISDEPFTGGKYGPGFTNKIKAYMFNAYARYQGLEVFGSIEGNSGTTAFGGAPFGYSQYIGMANYYLGAKDQFYIGGRIDVANNSKVKGQGITRFETGLGWFFTKNIIIKATYVTQNYRNFSQYGNNAGFNGIMFEAGVSF